MINSILTYALLIIFSLLLLAGCFNIIISVLSFAPWLPIRRRDLSRVFKLANLQPGETFYDLGCGDGRVIFYAGRYFRAQAVGLEISWALYLLCRLKKFFDHNPLVKFKLKNLFKENLAAADAVYFFGIPTTINKKLSAKLKRELRPGAKIISYSFKLDGWKPVIVDKPTEKDLPVYLYQA
ncbi:MAG: class I SAM-dependent methyltransferase [Patescibacteria group bacterium]|nr:class I SAM-dependent methyltransferase [Patescibacteria group bacterium]